MPIAHRRLRSGLTAGILAVTLALTGCANDKQAAGGQREVAFLASSLTGPFSAPLVDGFRFGVALVPGVTARVEGPQTLDLVAQMNMLQGLTKDGIRSVSLATPFTEISGDPLGQAAALGARLIAVDAPPLPGTPVELYIGNDNHGLGRLLADTVAEKLGADATGKVVLTSPRNGVPQLDARALGFRERMRERLPKVRVVGPLDTSDRPDAAASAWESVTRANKDAIAFVSVGANGAVLAGLRQKQKATWLAASFDIEPKALEAVKRGEIVLVSPEHFLKGAVAGKLQAQYAGRESELPTGWLQIPGAAVTPANVDEFIARDASTESKERYFTARLDEILGQNGPQMRPLTEAQ